MSRIVFRIGLIAALLGSLTAAAKTAPDWLRGLSVFDARTIEVQGAAYLTDQQVVRAAGLGPGESLWEDPSGWEERLERHPMVRTASVERRFPSTLVVKVEERQPVGLVPTPTLVPVDAEGNYLPLDPSRFPLDYPVLRPGRREADGDGRPATIRVRPLAQVAAVLRRDAEFWRNVSEIRPGARGTVEVRWGDPEVVFQFPIQVEEHRIRMARAAIRQAETRAGSRRLVGVDQRYGEHVTLVWEGEAEQ